jgi:misacylated tRNA(Ala) deacylase
MNKPLYFDDSYLKEFDSVVVAVDGANVILENTAFYPTSGGQLNDTGTLAANGKEYAVKDVKKSDTGIVHILAEPGLAVGDKVHGVIDWERRYRMMRMHSAAHVLCASVHALTGAYVNGKQLDITQSKIDFTLETFDRNAIQQFGDHANATIAKGAPIKMFAMPREEAMKIPDLVKLAEKMPPDIAEWRIVEIVGVDIQPCGGTHVKDIKEIGNINVIKAENKGATKRRMYYALA